MGARITKKERQSFWHGFAIASLSSIALAILICMVCVKNYYSFDGVRPGLVKEIRYNEHDNSFNLSVEIDGKDYIACVSQETKETIEQKFPVGSTASFAYGNPIFNCLVVPVQNHARTFV